MATTIELKNSVTTGNSPSTLAQGEMGVNITDKKVWIGNASSTPIQLIGAGASMSLTSLTTSSDASISGLTVGKGGGAVGSNTAVGSGAIGVSNTGTYNTAFGISALSANTSGGANSAFGYSLIVNTTGVHNSGYGTNSLVSNTSGSYNIALGNGSLQSNTTASYNTAVGYQAGYTNGATAGYNVFLGYQAGYTSNAGTANSYNTFVGPQAGYSMTTGYQNTILGGYTGNQGGLDIRTSNNYIVLSDGAGNPLISTYNGGTTALKGAIPNAGIGITFPATQSASSDANTLDDYEEGTFTPTIGGTSIVYTNQVGSYTKVGRMVYIQGYIAIGSGSPTGVINNLPFTSMSGGSAFSMGVNIYFSNGSTTFPVGTTQIVTYIAPNNTSVNINAQGSTINAQAFSSLSSTVSLYFTGCYQTA